LLHLAGGGSDQTELQLKSNPVKTTALTTLHKRAVLPDLTIPTNLVDRRNQILLTSHSLGETTSEFPLVYQYQVWIPKE
jgi:hypothetical protein